MHQRLKTFVGILMLALVSCKSVDTPIQSNFQTAITANKTPTKEDTCKELQDFMHQIQRRRDYNAFAPEDRVMTPQEIAVEKEITKEFKDIITEIMKNKGSGMGVCQACFEQKILPIITRLHFGGDTSYLGKYTVLEGEIFIKGVIVERSMVYTSLHELGHVYGYGEDASSLFAERIMGLDGEPQPRENLPIASKSDWVYNTKPLRVIYEKAVKNGEEQLFWESMRTIKGQEYIWNRYCPTYSKNGELHPYMSFQEWQDIKAVSGINPFTHTVNAGIYKEETGKDLDLVLGGLNIAFEKLDSQPQKFNSNVRNQIAELSNFAQEQQFDPIYLIIKSPNAVHQRNFHMRGENNLAKSDGL